MRRAAILAGGQARRFGGADKSALLVEGRPILERQIAELRAVRELDEIVLVGSAAPRMGLRSLADRVPGLGPLAGIHAALCEPGASSVFVVACDMPYITAPFVEYLFELSADADVVVPRTDRGYHPLCAVYSAACAAAIERRLGERRLRVMDLFDDVRARVVSAEELGQFGDHHRLLANVNTPTEYAALLEGQEV